MKKLYLTSVNLNKLITILPNTPDKLKLALIPTAADPYEDKWFVNEDRINLKKMGFMITEIDINNKNEEQLRKLLDGFDVIYVAGGNGFYLLEKMRQSGFDKIIDDLLKKGVIYAGASAGAVVMGSDIAPLEPLDDPKKAPNLTSTKGLGYVNFVILPHYGKEKYAQKYKDLMSKYGKKFDLVTLTDEQVIIVEGRDYHIVNCE